MGTNALSSARPATERPAVLVIEDDAAIRESLALLLDLEGYRGIFASNGAEGFEALRKNSAEIGVVLLDLMMPVMDGREFLDKLSAEGSEREKALPVYVCSAIKEIGTSPVTGVLRKPIDLPVLLETLQKHCG